MGLAVVDAGPVGAQIPDLFPTSTTTTVPGTTSTLLPPLDTLLNPTSTSTAPGQTTTTAAPLLPLPKPGASTSRTTTFVPTPIPPKTALRTVASTVPRASRSQAPTTAAPAEEMETGEGGGDQFAASLPYSSGGGERVSGAAVNMELGSGAGNGIGTTLSVVGGIVASALLAGVIWLKRQVK
ncbi:MAG: hypothetical protein ACRD0S_06565, partial [Acidimicrobiales bacterium]